MTKIMKASENKERALRVEVSKDHKTAWLITSKDTEYTIDELKMALKKAGAIKGTDELKLQKAAAGTKLLTSEPIAKIIPPEEGQAAQLRYLISHEVKPKESEDGTLDFKEINLVKNIRAGDLLLRKIPPQIGACGFLVTGEEIPGKPGKDLKIKKFSGPGTEVQASGEYKNEDEDFAADMVVAKIDGIYRKQKDGKVAVLNVLTVDGDVDYSTGNIKSTSDVIIMGDIKAGFKVECAGDLNVKGLIEDAEVSIGGDLYVNQGITQGEKSIYVDGLIKAMYLYHRFLVKCGEIKIREMISHVNIISSGEVNAGKIIGGDIKAKGDIVVNEAGSELYESKTILTAGLDLEKIELRAVLREELEMKRSERGKIKNEQSKLKLWAAEFKLNSEKMLNEISQINNPTISDKIKSSLKSKLARIQEIGLEISQITGVIDEYENRIDELNQELAHPKAKIKITGTVFAGVRVGIGELQHLIITETERQVNFMLNHKSEILGFKL